MWRFLFVKSIHNGISVFELDGKETPVVFLHGLGGQALHGAFLTHAFPNHRIILIELPGHGQSPRRKEDPDIYLITQEIHQLLLHLGVEKPIICGHSLGGQMALLYAVMYPESLSSLLLIAPAGLEEFDATQKLFILNAWNMSSMFQNFIPPPMLNDLIPEQVIMPNTDVTASYMGSMLDRPMKGLLDRVKCRTDIFFGTFDPLIPNKLYTMDNPVRFAEKVVNGLSNFEVHPLPGCGHWPMIENPVLLIQQIQSLHL